MFSLLRPVSKADFFEAVGVADGVADVVGQQLVFALCAAVVTDSSVGRQSE